MWPLRLWDAQEVTLVLFFTCSVCHLAEAISVYSPQRSLTRWVQEDVLFSVNISCQGVPIIQWTFMSGAVSRAMGAWQPWGTANITEDYRDRVYTYTNGSMGLSDLRLQDAGYYVLTVTDASGSSRDTVFVLKVNEVLYEDLQYLSVFVAVLGVLAGLLMVSMWLIDKGYRCVKAWWHKRQTPEINETELQRL